MRSEHYMQMHNDQRVKNRSNEQCCWSRDRLSTSLMFNSTAALVNGAHASDQRARLLRAIHGPDRTDRTVIPSAAHELRLETRRAPHASHLLEHE